MKIHKLWIVCIIVRSIIAYLPQIYKNNKNINSKIISVNKYLILFIGLGFLYKAIFGSNDETQIAKVFWHKTRIIHAILFILSYINFYNYDNCSLILFSSVLFSVFYRYTRGDFN